MTKKVFRGIFIALSFILFIFLVKYFYFDTKMGFNTEILELNYSAFPMWFDVLISVVFMPLLVFAIFDELYDRANEVGGLVSGEHGIGYAKKGYMHKMLGDTQIEIMRGIKKAFDPNNILNPGKII